MKKGPTPEVVVAEGIDFIGSGGWTDMKLTKEEYAALQQSALGAAEMEGEGAKRRRSSIV
jgi:hypothetical protein